MTAEAITILATNLGPVGVFLDTLIPEKGDFFWQSSLFRRDVWETIMRWIRFLLTFGGALLILYAWRARKLGERFRERSLKRIGIVMSVIAFGVYFDFGNPNVRYQDYYHRHELFHYYLGSKYFEEIGYTRLYECAAIAELENRGKSAVINRELRNLRVNLIQPVKDTDVYKNPDLCKRFFQVDTDAGGKKWEAFKKDVAWFEKVSRGSYWQNMQKDHGFNPPPVWTMEGKFFSAMGNAGHDFFLALAGLDVAFHIGTILLFGWAFGWRVMTVAAVFWGCNAPANFYWTGGAFLRHDWLLLLVASICLLKKGKHFWGGAALAYSSLLRVFPIVVSAGWIVIMAIYFIKHRKFHPDHVKVVTGGLAAGAVLIPLSAIVCAPTVQEEGSTTPAILAPYKDFVSHILVHNQTPLTNHMGLETIVVHDWMPSLASFSDGTFRDEANGRMRFTRNDNLDDPFEEWKQGRRDRKKERAVLFWALRLMVAGWLVWALRRTKHLWIGMALSPLIVMCAVNMTCYYFSVFMISAALVAVRPSLGPILLIASGASQVLLHNYYWVDDKYTAQSYLFFALGLLLFYGYSRPFTRERLEAWLKGKPEPKPKVDAAAAPQPAE